MDRSHHNGKFSSKIIGICMFGLAFGCGPSSGFNGSNGKIAASPLPVPIPKANDALPLPPPPETESLVYQLQIAGGAEVLAPGRAEGRTWIVDNNAAGAKEISPEAAQLWKATTTGIGVAELSGPLGKRELDFTKASGYTRVDAAFLRTSDKHTGFASQTVFIDGEPPTATMIIAKRENNEIQVQTNIFDNYGISEDHSNILACKPSVTEPYDANGDLSADCSVVVDAAQFKSKGATLVIPDSPDVIYFITAKDLVQNRTVARAIEPSNVNPFLEISAGSIIPAIVGGGIPLDLILKLNLFEQGKNTAIHTQENLWADYRLELDCRTQGATTGTPSQQPFVSPLPLDTKAEGPINCSLMAQKVGTELKSNKLSFGYVVDKTPPVITNLKVYNPQGFLSPTTPVTITFNASDENGIATQKIEYRPKGTTEWLPLADVPTGDTSVTILWGSRPKIEFEVRVVAVDRAKNAKTSDPAKWSLPFFNAAVLTSSVKCFFCHLKIEGDLAGINFPTVLWDKSGENLNITGTVFGTGRVPPELANKAAAKVENYRNEGLKIFPTTKDAAGVPVFPTISEARLEANANGLLVNGAGRAERVSRIHEGNLTVEGTAAQPFQVSGEVFVKGDLYIKGVYSGRGTIYARNILVVDDIISNDCINPSTCPFPFEGTEAEKIAKAQQAIASKKSALYLGSLKETLVGDRDHTLAREDAEIPTSPTLVTSPAEKAYHESLGRQAINLPDIANNTVTLRCCEGQIADPTTSPKVNVEVNRVDAYLYAHNVIVWRSYGNLLINGGFMGFQAALVSTYPIRILYNQVNTPGGVLAREIINPRNGMNARQNVIRYDYRLRAGGPGFETLKEFFAE